MNLNDSNVINSLNKLIITDRLNKAQILHLVKLVELSNDIRELKENLYWETC